MKPSTRTIVVTASSPDVGTMVSVDEPYAGDTLALCREICELGVGMRLLGAAEAQDILRSVAALHGMDVAAVRWWENLPLATALVYGDSHQEWKVALQDLLMRFGSGQCAYLVVTDDEASPWPVVRMDDPSGLMDVLEGMQFFEYFVVSHDCSKVVFDTHGNVLVASMK